MHCGMTEHACLPYKQAWLCLVPKNLINDCTNVVGTIHQCLSHAFYILVVINRDCPNLSLPHECARPLVDTPYNL